MLPFEDRYTRQRQVPEVGIDGQERLSRLEVQVSREPDGDVEALYLERAGVSVVRQDPSNQAAFPHAELFRHGEPHEFAASAHRALCVVRHALGLDAAAKDEA